MSKPSNFKEVQDAVKQLESLLDLIPTGFQTTPDERTELTNALSTLVKQAEKYPKRNKKRKNGDEEERRADWLDEKGVKLWNAAMTASRQQREDLAATMQTPQAQDNLILAHLKYAGFKLIDAATVTTAAGPYLVRLVGLSAKAVSALLVAGDTIKVSGLIYTAADLEKKLLAAPEPTDAAELEDRLSALIVYYLARCDVAVNESNIDLAFSMTQKAFEVCSGRNVGVTNFKMVATKFWKVGNGLRNNPETINEACLWLQKGLEVVNEAEKMDSGVGIQDIKVALLRTTARAELSKESPDGGGLDRATSALSELYGLSNTLDPRSVHETQILRLGVLQRQNAKEVEVKTTLYSLMNTITWEDEQVDEILGEILNLKNYKDLQTHARQTLLAKAVENTEGHRFVTTILLSILLALRKQVVDFQTAIRVITQALDKVSDSEVPLDDQPGVYAGQTILWSFGELAFQKGEHTHAAEWYLLCAHKAYYPLGKDNFPKCWRKAALAYINDGDMASAQIQLDRCPSNEASTQYLGFLIAASQGRALGAMTAVEAILSCPDLDGKQLLLMAQVASDKGLDTVLTACLKSMLAAISRPEISATIQIPSIQFIRCLVSMNLEQIKKAEDQLPLVETLAEYLTTAVAVVEDLKSQGEAQQHLKGIAWLYKTGYNAGIDGSMKWTPTLVGRIFDATEQLMTLYQELTTLDNDPELPLQRATAMFSCLCANLFDYREMEDGDAKESMLGSLLGYIPGLRAVVAEIEPTVAQAEKLSRISQAVAVMEAEILCEQGSWEDLKIMLEDAMANKMVTRELEAVITVLAKFRNCPISLMIQFLEYALRSASLSTAPEIVRLSRWTRSLVSSLLHRVAESDEMKAAYFVNRSWQVLRSEFGNEAYPADEQMWLVSTAWARGHDRLSKGDLKMGQQWCHMALNLAQVVKGVQNDLANMQKNYEQTLRKLGLQGHPMKSKAAPRARAIMN